MGRLSQKPMSLVLNCESAVITTTAKEVSLPFSVSGGMEHRLSHGFWRQHEPLISTQSSAATWTSDAIMALGSRTGHGQQRAPWWPHGSWTSTRLQAVAQTTAICMAFGGNMGIRVASWGSTDHRHPQGIQWQHGSQTSTWSRVATQTTDTNLALGRSIDYGHNHGLWQQNRLWTSACPLAAAWPMNINMASGGSTDHAHPSTQVVYF